jgi:adhesin transport system outer membrane protein
MGKPPVSSLACLRPLHRRLSECGLLLTALLGPGPAGAQAPLPLQDEAGRALSKGLSELRLRASEMLSPRQDEAKPSPVAIERPAAKSETPATRASSPSQTRTEPAQSLAEAGSPAPREPIPLVSTQARPAVIEVVVPVASQDPASQAASDPGMLQTRAQNSALAASLGQLPPEALSGQGGLSLRYLLEQVALAHPSVQAARIDIRASAEDKRAQERQRWPTMSALVENKSSNPTVAATRVLRVEQTLWDAGRISARINEAGTALNINQARVYITVQQLSLQLVAAWQNLKGAEGRMAVAYESLDQLERYRAQMERRVQAEASPPIDLELMRSRILQTEVELNQAVNARLQALSRIEQLSGLPGLQEKVRWSAPALPPLVQMQGHVDQLKEVDWFDVARRHPSVEKTRQESLVARQRLDGKRAELYPQLYLRVDRPIGALNNDVAGFVGFRYTPGAGLATSVEAQALAERAASLEQATEVAVREISEALASDRDELQSSRSRMLALQKAVLGSREVLESYGRQFIAGRKTWLDLLNAVRELSQNQYALADSHAAMLAALYRLQVRMGEPVQPAS